MGSHGAVLASGSPLLRPPPHILSRSTCFSATTRTCFAKGRFAARLLVQPCVPGHSRRHACIVQAWGLRRAKKEADAPTSNAAPVAEVDATPAAAPETHAPSNDTRVLTSSIGDRTSSSIGSSSSNTAAAPTALLVERQAAARELIQPPTDEPEQQEEQDLVSEDDPAVLYQYQQQLQQQQQQQEEAEEQQQQKQGYAAWQGSVAEAASGSTHPAFQRLSASGQQQQHTSPAPAPAPTSTLPAGPAAASSPSPSLLNTPLAPVFALAAIAAFVYTRVKKRHAEAKDSSSKSGGVAAKEQAGAAGPLDMASKTPGVGTAKPGGRGGSSGSLFRRPASQTGAGAAPGAGAAGVGGAKTLAPLPAVPGEGPLSGAASGTQAGGGAGAGVAAAAAGAGSAGAAGAAAGPTPRSTVARERGWWRRLRKLYYISFGAQYGIVPFVRMALASGGLAARSAVRPLMGGGGGAGGGGGGLMGGAGGGEMSIVAFEDPADAEYVANLLWEDLLLRGEVVDGARPAGLGVMSGTPYFLEDLAGIRGVALEVVPSDSLSKDVELGPEQLEVVLAALARGAPPAVASAQAQALLAEAAAAAAKAKAEAAQQRSTTGPSSTAAPPAAATAPTPTGATPQDPQQQQPQGQQRQPPLTPEQQAAERKGIRIKLPKKFDFPGFDEPATATATASAPSPSSSSSTATTPTTSTTSTARPSSAPAPQQSPTTPPETPEAEVIVPRVIEPGAGRSTASTASTANGLDDPWVSASGRSYFQQGSSGGDSASREDVVDVSVEVAELPTTSPPATAAATAGAAAGASAGTAAAAPNASQSTPQSIASPPSQAPVASRAEAGAVPQAGTTEGRTAEGGTADDEAEEALREYRKLEALLAGNMTPGALRNINDQATTTTTAASAPAPTATAATTPSQQPPQMPSQPAEATLSQPPVQQPEQGQQEEEQQQRPQQDEGAGSAGRRKSASELAAERMKKTGPTNESMEALMKAMEADLVADLLGDDEADMLDEYYQIFNQPSEPSQPTNSSNGGGDARSSPAQQPQANGAGAAAAATAAAELAAEVAEVQQQLAGVVQAVAAAVARGSPPPADAAAAMQRLQRQLDSLQQRLKATAAATPATSEAPPPPPPPPVAPAAAPAAAAQKKAAAGGGKSGLFGSPKAVTGDTAAASSNSSSSGSGAGGGGSGGKATAQRAWGAWKTNRRIQEAETTLLKQTGVGEMVARGGASAASASAGAQAAGAAGAAAAAGPGSQGVGQQNTTTTSKAAKDQDDEGVVVLSKRVGTNKPPKIVEAPEVRQDRVKEALRIYSEMGAAGDNDDDTDPWADPDDPDPLDERFDSMPGTYSGRSSKPWWQERYQALYLPSIGYPDGSMGFMQVNVSIKPDRRDMRVLAFEDRHDCAFAVSLLARWPDFEGSDPQVSIMPTATLIPQLREMYDAMPDLNEGVTKPRGLAVFRRGKLPMKMGMEPDEFLQVVMYQHAAQVALAKTGYNLARQ